MIDPRLAGLAPNFCEGSAMVTDEEHDALILSFTEEEIEFALRSMKSEIVLGPDGLPVIFFKKLGMSKEVVCGIVNGFALGTVDIARLNYAILSLIPKVKGAEFIKQYRPIALVNVIFKLVVKSYAIRLSPIASHVVNPCQFTFIKGRHILEGVLSLHKIVHEIRSKKNLLYCSSWILRKRTTG